MKQSERGRPDGQNINLRCEKKDHAETTGYEVRSTDVEILERGVINHQKRLFLEAVHSVKTKDSVNEHIELPSAYLPLITSLQ